MSVAVYFLQPAAARSRGIVKIGHSSRPRSRRACEIARGEHPWPVGHRPGTVTLLLELPGGHAREQATHARFRHLALGREWFRAEPELLAFVAAARAHQGTAVAA